MWKKSDGSTWNVNDTDLSEMDIFTLNTVYSKPHYTITLYAFRYSQRHRSLC